jgi:GNAT superfamily N-acetyltransferase
MVGKSERDEPMDTHEITQRILEQRRQRFPAEVPGLDGAGRVPCRVDGRRLRIGFASAAPGRASQLVGSVLAYCAAHGYDVQWNVMPALPGESEIAPSLLARGLQEEEVQRLMAHTGQLSAARPPRVTILPLDTLQAMVAYEAGSRAAFYDDLHPLPAIVERRATERLHEQQRGWYRYVAALLDGRPVGGCYYSRYETIPTIMGVYTVPEARRQGVATALLAYTVRSIRAEGFAHCCLYVRLGNPAERLYRHLGFVPLLDEYSYTNAPEGNL